MKALLSVASLIFLFLPSPSVLAAQSSEELAPPVKAALQASATYELLTGSPFAQTGSSGTGLSLTGERYLNDRFGVAINLAYRYFPGDQSMSQIGYGLLLKHYLGSEGFRAPGTRFFFEYGLLLQIITLGGRTGSGTAHDTRLSIGTDFEAFGAPLFLSLSYHFSTLRYFENPSIPLDYVGVEFGPRFSW